MKFYFFGFYIFLFSNITNSSEVLSLAVKEVSNNDVIFTLMNISEKPIEINKASLDSSKMEFVLSYGFGRSLTRKPIMAVASYSRFKLGNNETYEFKVSLNKLFSNDQEVLNNHCVFIFWGAYVHVLYEGRMSSIEVLSGSAYYDYSKCHRPKSKLSVD